MTHNDRSLQLALAKMLPDSVRCVLGKHDICDFRWKDNNREIYDTEWLYICWLIEQGMEFDEKLQYAHELYLDIEAEAGDYADFKMSNASWQQRAIALCKLKGVKV